MPSAIIYASDYHNAAPTRYLPLSVFLGKINTNGAHHGHVNAYLPPFAVYIRCQITQAAQMTKVISATSASLNVLCRNIASVPKVNTLQGPIGDPGCQVLQYSPERLVQQGLQSLPPSDEESRTSDYAQLTSSWSQPGKYCPFAPDKAHRV